MIKSMMLCSFLSLAAYSQYGRSYTVMDDYYQRNIQIEDTGSSVNQKINNPGLYKNSNSRSGIGFLQSLYDYKNSYELDDQSIGFDDLYAWTELNTDIGNFGGYVGNVSLNTNSNENNLNLDSKKQNGSLSAAIWFNPAKKMFFKGLSISADERYSYNRSNTSGQNNNTNNKTEENGLQLKAVSLFQLSEKLHLRWGISGGKNIDESDYMSVISNNNSYNYSYYNNATYYSGNKSKNKQYSGDMNVGLILNRCFDLTIGAQVYTINLKNISSSKTIYYGYEYNNVDNSVLLGSGVLSFYLNCALEKIINYRKHKLYLGIDANIRASLYDNNDDYYTNFGDVMKNVDKDQRNVSTSVLSPVTMDINLFNLPLFAVVKVVPGLLIDAEHLKSNGNKTEFSSSKLFMEKFAFGLKGKIGEKVEFAFIPRIESKIFIGGAEVNYTFGKSKT